MDPGLPWEISSPSPDLCPPLLRLLLPGSPGMWTDRVRMAQSKSGAARDPSWAWLCRKPCALTCWVKGQGAGRSQPAGDRQGRAPTSDQRAGPAAPCCSSKSRTREAGLRAWGQPALSHSWRAARRQRSWQRGWSGVPTFPHGLLPRQQPLPLTWPQRSHLQAYRGVWVTEGGLWEPAVRDHCLSAHGQGALIFCH